MDENFSLLTSARLFEEGPVVVFRWRNAPGWPVEEVTPNVRQFGYEAKDFTGGRVPYPDFIHPDDLERVAREVAEHTAARSARFEQNYRVIRADGLVRQVQDITAPQYDVEGRVTHFLGYLLDRSETIEAARESERRNARLLEALEGSGTGLWDLRLPDGEVLLDRASQELAGLDPSQPVTQIDQWLELIHPDDRPRVEEHLNQHLAGQSPLLQQELRLARPDGTWRWLLLKGRVVERDADGLALRLLGTIHDIHGERIRLEDEARLREQELRLQKMSSLEQVAAGVAHRFNNLLASLLGNLELLLLDPALEPAQAERLEEMQGTAVTASELAQALLSYTGNRLMRQEEVDSGAWLARQAPLWRESLRIGLELELEEGLPTLWMDAGQLDQALRQVLANALEAGSPQPLELRAGLRRQLEPRRQPVVGQEPAAAGPWLLLSVKDRGPGMSVEHLERVFDPFFTTRFVGRGLGMAMVRGVLLGHRGGIRVHSRPGEGTIVDIYLPVPGGAAEAGSWLDALGEEGVPVP
jgi:PAS domain S-box-containing protein